MSKATARQRPEGGHLDRLGTHAGGAGQGRVRVHGTHSQTKAGDMRCANPIVTFLHLQVGDASAIVAGMPSPVARREPGARQTKTRRPNSSRRCHRLPTAKCIQSISLGQAAKLRARSLMSWRYGAGVIHVFAGACYAAVIVGEIWWLATTQSRCRSITDCYTA